MRALVAIILLIAAAFWGSVLSFYPVPWPDDSAFFLTGLEWLRAPFTYRMHAQAPFVPSYDVANFNTMPLLPLLLGLGARLGIASSHAIRLFGIAALAAWAVCLALWMRRRGVRTHWIWAVTLAALLSPTLRWGSMVVRTEVWQGLLWILILMELDGFFRRANAWRLPALLALAAGFHFEAVVWVAPVAIGLAAAGGGTREIARRLVGVGWRTVALLSPWLIYVLANWTTFWEQMGIQFGRLHAEHPYIQSAHGLFHSLFISLGNPSTYPKFFNLGKIILWCVMVLTTACVAWRSTREKQERAVRVAAVLALGTTFYLWATKPETWFTVLIHFSIWPIVVLSFKKVPQETPRAHALASVGFAALSLLAVIQAGVAVHQARAASGTYSWQRYGDWIGCIESALGTRKRIWQPHWPDILVELAGRDPTRDLTRAVDFQGIDSLLRRHAENSEAVIHSLYLEPGDRRASLEHTGPARDDDRYFLGEYPWLPFKEFSAPRMGAGWDLTICQRGPFWAAISLRKAGL